MRRETKLLTEAKRFAAELLLWCNVAAVGSTEAIAAVGMNLSDLEDAMQIAAAMACQADVIVTRNPTDFTTSPISVMTPEDFVQQRTSPSPS